ncbi:beta-galactosidase [bacterium]|nr:beta-galactosidase [bacterium]
MSQRQGRPGHSGAALATTVLLAALSSWARAGQGQPQHPPSVKLDVATDRWRATDDVVDGWDWSLPPGIEPVRRSGLCFGGTAPKGFRGNHLVKLNWTWRQIEPEEARYDFASLAAAIKRAAETHDGVILHVRASVTDITDHTGRMGKHVKGHNQSAPAWLIEKYGIPTTAEKVKSNIATPFTVVNAKLDHPDYHRRYLKMVAALGASSVPAMAEATFVLVHGISGSRGEEWGGVQTRGGRLDACFRERLDAWAAAFKGHEHKLTWVGHAGPLLQHAYTLGMGQRCGFVEMYLTHVENPDLGQRLDADGYLVVDEACPLLDGKRSSGDENEEYSPRIHVPRFGPIEAWPHRYRESMLRALQMRRNWLWAEWRPWVNPPLFNYVGLELGRTLADAPDAWCYLRQSTIGRGAGKKRRVVAVKNFERWLHQRDRPGAVAEATIRVDHPIDRLSPRVPKEFKHDLIARRTDRAKGHARIGFALDDRFLAGGPHHVAIKVTFHDIGKGRWHLVCPTARGAIERPVECRDLGIVHTATFFLRDAVFPARKAEFDFQIVARDVDATVSFVRVVKLK